MNRTNFRKCLSFLISVLSGPKSEDVSPEIKPPEKYITPSVNIQVYRLIISQIIFKDLLEYLPEYQILELESDPDFKQMCFKFLKNKFKMRSINNFGPVDSSVKHVYTRVHNVGKLSKFTKLKSLKLDNHDDYKDYSYLVNTVNEITTLKSLDITPGFIPLESLDILRIEHLKSISMSTVPTEKLLNRMTNFSALGLNLGYSSNIIFKYLGSMMKLTKLDITLGYENDTFNENINKLINLKDLRICGLSRLKETLKLDNPKLDNLTLYGRCCVSFKGINVRQLTIGYIRLPLNKYEDISQMSRLRNLTIDTNELTDDLFAPITKMVDLEKLTVRFCKLTNVTFETAEWPKLYYLHIPYNEVTSNVFYKFKCLRYLNICSNKISKFEGIPRLSNLFKLNIRSNKLSPENFQEIFKLTKLRSLDIQWTVYNINHFNGIQNLTNLRKLNINHNDHYDSWNPARLEWLRSLKKLETLKINLKYFSLGTIDVLCEMSNLRRLEIYGITKDQSEPIWKMPKLEYASF